MTGPAAHGRSRDEIARTVGEVLAEILPGTPADPLPEHKHLRDLGADSVDRVEIILQVLDRLGVEAPLSAFTALPDLHAMIDFLCERSTR
jgi:polyketide biosynthesis acyl carrier protein